MDSILVKNLSKHFGEFKAVNNVSFSVRRGEIFGFLGPNGSGKSTTIRMLCGLLGSSMGTAVVAGFDINTEPEKIKTKIGYMSQRFSLYNDLTVEQNLTFWGSMYKLPESQIKRRSREIYEWLEIGDLANRQTGTLSAGWKQRLSLGCAIIHEPEIVFLDEPTGGVDPISRRNFWSLINQLSKTGTTVFVTTHFLDEAEYCHSIGLIYDGELIVKDTPNNLKYNLIKEQSIEMILDHPMAAIELLKESSLFSNISIFGTKLHGVLNIGANFDNKLVESVRYLLGTKEITLEAMNKITPSLEDVFIYMIETRSKKK